MTVKNSKITFVGAGNMAGAIIAGLLKNGVDAKSITAAEPSLERLEILSKEYGIRHDSNNVSAVANADVVVLSVKPQILQSVCEGMRGAFPKGALVISIAAGVEMRSIEEWLGGDVALVRCMPNTPAQVLAGASGLFANTQVNAAQKDIAYALFSAIGVCQWVESEDLLHAVTALSGSGPAYVFLVIDAMEKAARKQGIDEKSARLLAAQTVMGAAQMVLSGDIPPEQLMRNVMSPGGTTERAIQVLEGQGLPAIFDEAMTAANQRSVELADLLKG